MSIDAENFRGAGQGGFSQMNRAGIPIIHLTFGTIYANALVRLLDTAQVAEQDVVSISNTQTIDIRTTAMNAISPIHAAGNVVRFPIERRQAPSADLVYRIAPTPEQVEAAAEVLDMEAPGLELREAAGMSASAHIVEHISPLAPAAQAVAFASLLGLYVADALDARRRLDAAEGTAAYARARMLTANLEPGELLDGLTQEVDSLDVRVAELVDEAFTRSEAVRGVERAIEMARQGATYAPVASEEFAEWLLSGVNGSGERAAG